MTELDIKKIGLKVGLEIHQQLDTKKKLFCDCTPIEEDEFSRRFSRRLRAAKSELGKIDPEFMKYLHSKLQPVKRRRGRPRK